MYMKCQKPTSSNRNQIGGGGGQEMRKGDGTNHKEELGSFERKWNYSKSQTVFPKKWILLYVNHTSINLNFKKHQLLEFINSANVW